MLRKEHRLRLTLAGARAIDQRSCRAEECTARWSKSGALCEEAVLGDGTLAAMASVNNLTSRNLLAKQFSRAVGRATSRGSSCELLDPNRRR